MQTPFEILAGFLESADGEVEGRALDAPPAAVQQQLREFARGKLPEATQKDVFDTLRHNPRWIPFLADEVKSLRGSTEGKT